MIEEEIENSVSDSNNSKKKKSLLKKLFIFFSIIFGIMSLAGILCLIGIYFYFSADLPSIKSLEDYRPSTISTVYSDDGRKIGEFYKERRIVIPLSEMPDKLLQAFVSAEDSRFFIHEGIDFYSIIRAFTKNIKAGAIVQGGSTITQQVTKSFFLTPERSYKRKIKEAILAYRIDHKFTKKEILYLYLNQIYLGHGAYGVEAASENYFGKSAKDLNLAECAMLAGLPQAPSRYSPFKYRERAKQRQIYVLNRMVAENYITNIQATEAINTILDIKARRNWYIEKVPCYTEYVRRYVEKKYGPEALYTQGLKIHTAVNIELQKIARTQVTKGLRDLDKRQGYRGPIKHLSPESIEGYLKSLSEDPDRKPFVEGNTVSGVVVDVNDKKQEVTVRTPEATGIIGYAGFKWARKPNPEVGYWEDKVTKPSSILKPGDVILVLIKGIRKNNDENWTGDNPEIDFLEKNSNKDNIREFALDQEPFSQSALLSIEAESGFVKAMIGGRDFKNSQFNRAIQSKRQPGSAFKPIIYSAAIDKGYTTASVIIDSPVIYLDEERDFLWKPNNYEKTFHGPTLLRKALTNSMNIVTIKILKDIGIEYVIDYAQKLGIESPLSRDLSIALGSSGVSLLELVSAYSVFPNLGYRVEPVFITRIEDRDGRILEETIPVKNKVIPMTTAYIMTSLLKGVVEHGTGRRVKSLNRPAAGKTGTTNNLYDAWFVGFTPRYITGVWVGNDEKSPLGKSETGSRAASPIWLGYMAKALEGKSVRTFKVPEGIVFAKIDAKTGLLPIPESKKTIFECFKEGTVPEKSSPKPGKDDGTDAIFKDNL